MNLFNHLKIRTQLMLSVSFLVIAAITVISTIMSYRVNQIIEEGAKALTEQTAYHYAYVVKAEVEIALDQVRTIANIFDTLINVENQGLSRRRVNTLLKHFIEINPNFMGVYAVFEPNTYDNKDINFVDEAGHDKTGRFIPYWSRNGTGEGVLEPVTFYDVDGKGDFYQIPKKRRKESIIDPHPRIIQGQEQLVVTLTVPILDKSRNYFLGAVGIDITLQGIQTLVSGLKISGYKDAYSLFCSNNGTIVASRNPAHIGKNVQEAIANQYVVDNVLKNKAFFVHRMSDTLKERVITYGVPVEIGFTEVSWVVAVNIAEDEVTVESERLMLLVVTVGIIAILIITILLYLLAKAIAKPLNRAVAISEAIALGKLNNDIIVKGKDETGQLLQAFATMQARLRERILEDKLIAESVHTAAEEISRGNSDLSQRTEQQATSLEETAASMEEMTGSVQQNADNSRQAAQLASNAREQALHGGEVVSTAVIAMNAINTSSKKVAEIIVVIDEIAFQTNLLALNAAVEAARAGEHGRGFAVVATEVRNLAQRSAKAAKEIKTLIQDSVEKVQEGMRLVNQSGVTLNDIVNAVKKVSDIVSEIAIASQEQANGIQQVNATVSQMDQMLEQNASLVEQAATASEMLKEQARNLRDHVAFFDTGEETVRKSMMTPKPPTAPTHATHKAIHKPVKETKEPQPTDSSSSPEQVTQRVTEWKNF